MKSMSSADSHWRQLSSLSREKSETPGQLLSQIPPMLAHRLTRSNALECGRYGFRITVVESSNFNTFCHFSMLPGKF